MKLLYAVLLGILCGLMVAPSHLWAKSQKNQQTSPSLAHQKRTTKVMQVTPETMDRILLAKANGKDDIKIKYRSATQENPCGWNDDQSKESKGSVKSEGHFNIGHVSNFRMPSSGGNDAMIVFAIIGIVVIIAIIPYFISFLYDVVTSGHCIRYHHKLSSEFSFLDSPSQSLSDYQSYKRNGFMAGLRWEILVDRGRTSGLGLVSSVGMHKLQESIEDINGEGVSRDSNGYYLMLGPQLYFLKTSRGSYGFAEIQGGTSTNENIKTIARSRVGVSAILGDDLPINFTFGLGATYIDTNRLKGVVPYEDKFSMELFTGIGVKIQ